MSWSKAEAAFHVVTPEVSHAPMSSLKDAAAELQDLLKSPYPDKTNRDMSVTPPVSHVEMWPYVASAAVASENHAVTAVRMVVSSATSGVTVRRGETVGFIVIDGVAVGAAVGATVGRWQSFSYQVSLLVSAATTSRSPSASRSDGDDRRHVLLGVGVHRETVFHKGSVVVVAFTFVEGRLRPFPPDHFVLEAQAKSRSPSPSADFLVEQLHRRHLPVRVGRLSRPTSCRRRATLVLVHDDFLLIGIGAEHVHVAVAVEVRGDDPARLAAVVVDLEAE